MSGQIPPEQPLSEQAPDIPEVFAACRENCDPLAHAFNECFSRQDRLAPGAGIAFDGSVPDPALVGPGLVIALAAGENVLLCLVPESLPLPEWYSRTDAPYASLLQTLASECALYCVPDDVRVDASITHAVNGLWDTLLDCRPRPDASLLPLRIEAMEPAATAGTGLHPASGATLWVVWPVAEVPLPSVAMEPAEDFMPQEPDSDFFAASEQFLPDPCAPAATKERATHGRRLLKIPVPIIVKLAEKKIELGQLLGMGPGSIVTFEKSCEDLLDLHVNNKLYCRGEAVKIGEKFGLKINEVGSKEQRLRALLG